MRALRPLVCLAVLAGAAQVRAEAPPARFIPSQANVVVEVKNPRHLVETILALETYKKFTSFPNIKELYGSTQYRRFQQLVSYYERDLGERWPVLLDKLAGGGIALGMKVGTNPPMVVLVIQGTDAATSKQFLEMALKVVEQEVNRQEMKAKIEKRTMQGVDVYTIGGEFHAALVGKTLLVSNSGPAMKMVLAVNAGKEKSIIDEPNYIAAGKILPPNPMVKAWASLVQIHERPEAKEAYKQPRDPFVTTVFGHYVDVFSQSPFACAAFVKEGNDFLATIRLPAGRDKLGASQVLHLADAGKLGALPLLEPRGVIYSNRFYFDFAKVWEERLKLYGEVNAKKLEKSDKDSNRLPFGKLQLSKLLMQAGARHRIVVASQAKMPYARTPKTILPAFAIVTEMRDPDNFSTTVEGLLRAGALFGGDRFGLQLKEEKYKDLPVVAYRFDEKKEVKQDVNDIRYNFTPCFVRVGRQFVVCSSLDLCRELIDILRAEEKMPESGEPSTAIDKFYGPGVADVLKAFEEQIVTSAVLDQAVSLEDAKKQAETFIAFVRSLGTLSAEFTFNDKTMNLDIRAKASK